MCYHNPLSDDYSTSYLLICPFESATLDKGELKILWSQKKRKKRFTYIYKHE
jgi:hypothetical protein